MIIFNSTEKKKESIKEIIKPIVAIDFGEVMSQIAYFLDDEMIQLSDKLLGFWQNDSLIQQLSMTSLGKMCCNKTTIINSLTGARDYFNGAGNDTINMLAGGWGRIFTNFDFTGSGEIIYLASNFTVNVNSSQNIVSWTLNSYDDTVNAASSTLFVTINQTVTINGSGEIIYLASNFTVNVNSSQNIVSWTLNSYDDTVNAASSTLFVTINQTVTINGSGEIIYLANDDIIIAYNTMGIVCFWDDLRVQPIDKSLRLGQNHWLIQQLHSILNLGANQTDTIMSGSNTINAFNVNNVINDILRIFSNQIAIYLKLPTRRGYKTGYLKYRNVTLAEFFPHKNLLLWNKLFAEGELLSGEKFRTITKLQDSNKKLLPQANNCSVTFANTNIQNENWKFNNYHLCTTFSNTPVTGCTHLIYYKGWNSIPGWNSVYHIFNDLVLKIKKMNFTLKLAWGEPRIKKRNQGKRTTFLKSLLYSIFHTHEVHKCL